MKTFNTHFKNMVRGMEDHQFRHFNHALGCMIYSKAHYLHEMKRQRMVPVDMAEEMAEDYERKHKSKDYKPTDKCKELLRFFQSKAGDNKGYIKLGDYPKAVREMRSMGMDFDRNIEEFMDN